MQTSSEWIFLEICVSRITNDDAVVARRCETTPRREAWPTDHIMRISRLTVMKELGIVLV